MPKIKQRVKPDDKEQSRLFIKKAREIEADEGKSVSDQLLGRLAKMPPEPRKAKNKRTRWDAASSRKRLEIRHHILDLTSVKLEPGHIRMDPPG
jgi:hypothetical protein